MASRDAGKKGLIVAYLMRSVQGSPPQHRGAKAKVQGTSVAEGCLESNKRNREEAGHSLGLDEQRPSANPVLGYCKAPIAAGWEVT